MRLLTSTDFTLRVLMRLAATPDTHVSTDALARELVISRHHLHKIVQYLTEAGLVRTIRGAHGGVMLARPAGKIKVGEVIRSHEQDQALVECFRADGGACNLLPRCRLRGMLTTAKNAFYSISITIRWRNAWPARHWRRLSGQAEDGKAVHADVRR